MADITEIKSKNTVPEKEEKQFKITSVDRRHPTQSQKKKRKSKVRKGSTCK